MFSGSAYREACVRQQGNKHEEVWPVNVGKKLANENPAKISKDSVEEI